MTPTLLLICYLVALVFPCSMVYVIGKNRGYRIGLKTLGEVEAEVL